MAGAAMRKTVERGAVLRALFVTFLWPTAWVLIKWGPREIRPAMFGGLRYAIAVCVLLHGLRQRGEELRTLTCWHWVGLLTPGLIFCTLTQGGQFLTLHHLDATPLSLILSFTPLFIAASGMVTLRERPMRLQWVGLAAALIGGARYSVRSNPFHGAALGFLLAGLTLCANVTSARLERSVHRRHTISSIVVTTISLGLGALLLLEAGFGTQGASLPDAQGLGNRRLVGRRQHGVRV